MAILSLSDVIRSAHANGWQGVNLIYISSISTAENQTHDTNLANPQNPNVVGLYQIDLHAHPDVTRSCAQDPNCSAAAALKIYNGRLASGGAPFQDWTTWSGGQAAAFIPTVIGTMRAMGGAYATATQQWPATPGEVQSAAKDTGSELKNGSAQPVSPVPSLPDLTKGLLDWTPLTNILHQGMWVTLGLLGAVIGVFLLVNPGGQIAEAIKADRGDSAMRDNTESHRPREGEKDA